MRVSIYLVVDSIMYFAPYIAVSYITSIVLLIAGFLIARKFSINSKINHIYGILMTDSFGSTIKLTALLTKLIFVITFFCFGFEHNEMIFLLFLLIDITFFLDGFKPFIFLLNITYSFSIYILMFTSGITKDYLLTVETTFAIAMVYISINIFTIFYSITATMYILTKSIGSSSKKEDSF